MSLIHETARGEVDQPPIVQCRADPCRRCRGEVDVPAGPFGEPVTDELGFVRCVVVHDNVNVEIDRDVALDLVEEFAELAGAMSRHACADDGSSLHVERREQRGCSIPLVVVGAPLGLPGPHRQKWLRAVEGLNLALLVDAQHDGAPGRGSS